MGASYSECAKVEEDYQKQFDEIQLPFEPCTVVSVELLGFRKISVGYSDYYDTPDPQFRIFCPNVKRPHLKEFKTCNIGDNTTKGFIGQIFKFVVPKDFPANKEFPIGIELSDLDYGSNDIIGTETIDASKLADDGTVLAKTLVFGKNNGELDIKMRKYKRTSPDFRYSLGLSDEEKAFRRKRIPIAFEAMKKLLQDEGPKCLSETPIVSLVASGGGYRAVVGMCGAMEALKDCGLLDIFTYACGLSGSSWYLAGAYTLNGMKPNEQQAFHDKIRDRFRYNLIMDMVNPLTMKSYQDYLEETRKKYAQPYTFVNYFPGYLVGKQMLDSNMNKTLSDMIPYVENAEVPYPLLVALHVKNRAQASQYHAYVERSPYEISIPSYGINLKTSQEGSTWNSGIIVKQVPEFPIHFTIAMTGCAFSILLNSFLASGGELDKDFASYIEQQRLNGKTTAVNGNHATNGAAAAADIVSDDDDEDDDDTANVYASEWNSEFITTDPHNNTTTDSAGLPTLAPDEKPEPSFFQKTVRSLPFFSSRNAVVGRTARVFNAVLGMDRVKRHHLNPLGIPEQTGVASHAIEAFGLHQMGDLTTKKNILSFADAGILKNVPTDVALRPQRRTELMIVMDFNGYESDDKFNYQPLLSAAAHAWQSGLEFPSIDFAKLTNAPPKEFLAFPSTGPNCPTVLWITLSNAKFKNLQNYSQKSTSLPPEGDTRKFNDFTVFGEGSSYSTFTFQYDNYHFDQLKELMYHNVASHIEDIKEALAKTILKKRRNLSKPN